MEPAEAGGVPGSFARGGPEVVICVEEFGPLNLQPRPSRQWAALGGKAKKPGREPRRRLRATFNRTGGVRHLLAACDLGRDRLCGHIKPRKTHARFVDFCRYVRSLCPREVRMAIVCGNFSPHLTAKRGRRVGVRAEANNAGIACTPTSSSWPNRIEAQFTALRYFALDGAGHRSHQEQGSMIRRYIVWRNRHVEDVQLRRITGRANVA